MHDVIYYRIFCVLLSFFKCLNFKIYKRGRPSMTSHNFGVKLVPLVTFHHQSLDCFLQNDVTNL